jgi:hypothetical protein
MASVAALSALGGMAHFLDRLRSNELKAHWGIELSCDILYSLATGFLFWYAVIAMGACGELAAAAAIIGGHLGAKFLFMLQDILTTRIVAMLLARIVPNDDPENKL